MISLISPQSYVGWRVEDISKGDAKSIAPPYVLAVVVDMQVVGRFYGVFSGTYCLWWALSKQFSRIFLRSSNGRALSCHIHLDVTKICFSPTALIQLHFHLFLATWHHNKMIVQLLGPMSWGELWALAHCTHKPFLVHYSCAYIVIPSYGCVPILVLKFRGQSLCGGAKYRTGRTKNKRHSPSRRWSVLGAPNIDSSLSTHTIATANNINIYFGGR